ncbi:glutamine-hydrolyzing carbamoyl-phosphate synthase small subunit [Alkalibacter rhizosphaerae]|uniref:Carbamoyl phosphate synthase small chain n=1 Tax=Alkalibacter rhizosphaerae TaxID=2815577 RepID=A0A974XGI1_9FIRM|nr:glutamine-hydrolyzing carbamoyl-phosphate synthase small subunit [Alkalibacter rhizosphaerae]QSX08295.1 glutamine-hydrolyzing carbamoyl-phosphate synthase small subunit [Alkalibacter rhizosphaerae]
MKAYLYLEDGSRFEGTAFGAIRESVSELVFNTGMTGYQEILTDPSYGAQTVVMTYPIIGSYGINKTDWESEKISLEGMVVREYCATPSHYMGEQNLDDYLKQHNVPGIYGVDTRMITKKIRNYGVMKCLLTYKEGTDHLEKLHDFRMPADLGQRFGTTKKVVHAGKGIRMGILDLGCKQGIINILKDEGCTIYQYPWNTSSQEILEDDLEGLLVSNGPGDPKDNDVVIYTLKDLTGKIPLRGICLGNQLLALALGADTYKMKFGHRGGNHPAIHLPSNRVIITSQNHGYAVEESSLPADAEVTWRNINDNTLEGFCHHRLDVEAVQFHPEEGPGPEEGRVILEEWIRILEEKKHAEIG